MRIEWDERKRLLNAKKHALDFADAAEVFASPMYFIPDTKHDYGEERWLGVGLLGMMVVTISFTYRGLDSVRIISMRKANRREVATYEEEVFD